ncbi:hypothetical protein TNCV_3119891 [Trichonephila clavipes]|uniref:Uncharacterized protein n=1 Tax=Trichonephila clavipes TaxID=2585209 RepID=A0A8X7BHN1_TRICX|nr:hypothetical protein TNCV_3119891 [Trichonephila clavipes]
MRFHSTNGKDKRDHLAEGTVSPESLIITPIFESEIPNVLKDKINVNAFRSGDPPYVEHSHSPTALLQPLSDEVYSYCP